MSAERLTIGALAAEMEAFGLKHASRQLADQLEAADANGLTCREFLERLLACELRGRSERRRRRSYAAAHFPPHPKQLDEFDPSELEGGISATQVAQLRELTWLDCPTATSSSPALPGWARPCSPSGSACSR